MELITSTIYPKNPILVSKAPTVHDNQELAGVSAGTSLGTVADGYLRIRATALPASLVNTVAVGAFRGKI